MDKSYYVQKLKEQLNTVFYATDFDVWLNTSHAIVDEAFDIFSQRRTNFRRLVSEYETKKNFPAINKNLVSEYKQKALSYLREYIQYLEETSKNEKSKEDHPITKPLFQSYAPLPPNQKGTKPVKQKIFISHSSKDKFIVSSFINIILDNALCFDTNLIFCSSIEGLKIKSGEDFRQRIKTELLQAGMVLQFISESYKKSEVCLNEMGAAWVLCNNVIPFIIGDKYDVGFIHAPDQQLMIGNKKDVLQFIDDNVNFFTKKSSHSKIDGHVDDFIKSVK